MRRLVLITLFVIILATQCYAAPPVFSGPIPDITIDMDTPHTIDMSAYFTDPDGDNLIFRSTTPDNVNLGVIGNEFTLTPHAGWQGILTMTFSANDSVETTYSNEVTVTVGNPEAAVPETPEAPVVQENRPPTLVDVNPADSPHQMTAAGETFFLTMMDVDGDELTFTWILDGRTLTDQTTETFTYSNPTQGTHSLRVVVSDGQEEAGYSWTLNVAGGPAPGGPAVGCGDGACTVAQGEDCETCEADCGCESGLVCEQGVCIPGGKNYILLVIIIGVGVLSLVVLAFVLAKYYSKKKAKAATQAPKVEGVTAEDLAFAPPGTPASEQPAKPAQPPTQPPPQKPAAAPSKPAAEGFKQPPPTQFDVGKQILEQSKKESSASPEILDYVKKMRQLGYQNDSIAQKLKSSGWKDSMIKDALKEK